MVKKGPGRPKLPKSKHKKRNYRRENAKFKSSPSAKKKAAERQKNRRAALKSGKVKKGDGYDLHHKNGRVTKMKASKNRGMKESSRKKGSKRNKARRGKL